MRKFLSLTVLAFVCTFLVAQDKKIAIPDKIGILPGEVVTQVLTANQLNDTVDWGHTTLNVNEAWKVTKGKGAKVAVLDTGWARNHKDLKLQVIAEKSFVAGETVDDLVSGHGTHCAGVIAGADNDWGIVGVAPESRLMIYKVLSNEGSGSVVDIAAAITEATAKGADVISMSLGGSSPDSFLPPAIKAARDKGVIVIAAAGNSGPRDNTIGFPGGYAGVICVAATGKNNLVAVFSSRGERIDIAAPGVNILSTIPGPGDGLFAQMSGTSMATPYIAGLAALWVSANQDIPVKDRPDRFFAALKDSCVDLPPQGKDTATGWGLPDAAKLVKKFTPPQPPVTPSPKKVSVKWADLSDAKKKELTTLGVTDLNLELSLKQ